MKRLNSASIEHMRNKNLPHADREHFTIDTLRADRSGTYDRDHLPEGTVTEHDKLDLLAYAKLFMPPQQECPCCGRVCGIRWSLQHGVAMCTNCTYPCRVYHYVILPGSTEVVRLQNTLWYHPDMVSTSEERKAERAKEKLEEEWRKANPSIAIEDLRLAHDDLMRFRDVFGWDGACTCHISAPCSYCTHPGNPAALAEEGITGLE